MQSRRSFMVGVGASLVIAPTVMSELSYGVPLYSIFHPDIIIGDDPHYYGLGKYNDALIESMKELWMKRARVCMDEWNLSEDALETVEVEIDPSKNRGLRIGSV